MSDVPQGPGWWQASDGKWYPPEQFQATTSPPVQPTFEQPSGFTQPAAGGPPVYPPQTYAPQPLGATPKTEGLAVASLVCALSGIVLWFACGIGFFATIAAIPLGIIARTRIRESNGQLAGDGMALAGLIIGSILTALGVIGIVAWIVLIATSSSST